MPRLPTKSSFLNSSTLRKVGTKTIANDKSKDQESSSSSKATNPINSIVLKPINQNFDSTNKLISESSSSSSNGVVHHHRFHSNLSSTSATGEDENLLELSKGAANDRACLLKFSQILEACIGSLSDPSPSSSSPTNKTESTPVVSLKQLVERTLLFRKACLTFAEESLLPQQRFRFRELLTKLEKNAETLRSNHVASAGGGGGNPSVSPGARSLLTDLRSNIKDIVGVVQK